MSKFNIFTIDLRVILWIIVATGVYALLLKFLQKNSPHRCSNEKGGGGKGFLNNVQKNCTFLRGWHPLVKLVTYISQGCYMDVSKLMHNVYMDFPKLSHGFV